MKKGDSSKMLSRRMLCIYLLVRELLLAIISNTFPLGRFMVTLSKIGRPTEYMGDPAHTKPTFDRNLRCPTIRWGC